MKLKNKITLMTLIIIILIVSLLSAFSLNTEIREIRKRLEIDLVRMSIILASNPIIQHNIGEEKGHEIINVYAEVMRQKTEVDFIVVTDMNAIRYSHTNAEKLGKPFSNSSINRAINNGDTYVEESKGVKGVTIKAFTPVISGGNQVGVVCVGVKKDYIAKAYKNFIIKMIPFILVVVAIGFIAAIVLSRNIKKQIYGLEPEEIAQLLKEREVIIDGITDGLIAISKLGKITLVNEKAKELLGIDDSCINKDISNLHHKILNKFNEVIESKSPIINLEQKLNDKVTIVSNYSLLENNGAILGAIMTFKRMDDVSVLIEMLAGVEKLNWDLRAQNHEFMNKLQTISGLIQLDRYKEALEYIHITTIKRNEIIKTLDNIKVVSIAALLLAKLEKAEEAKISMNIDSESNLKTLPKGINEIELGCIIGNLLENSIEALKGKKDGEIKIKIDQEDKLKIIVSNNGEEISKETRAKIFLRGYSTKGDNRGLGLSNICEIIYGASGELSLNSTSEKTEWIVEI